MANNKIFFIFKNNVLKLLFFCIFFSNYLLDGSLCPFKSNEIDNNGNLNVRYKSLRVIITRSARKILQSNKNSNNNAPFLTDVELTQIKEKLTSITKTKETIFPGQSSSTVMSKNFIDELTLPYRIYKINKVMNYILFFPLSMILPAIILYYYIPIKRFPKLTKSMLTLAIAGINTFCCKNTYDHEKEKRYTEFVTESLLKRKGIVCLTHKNININDEISYIGHFQYKEEFVDDMKKTTILSAILGPEIIFPDTFPNIKYYIFAKKAAKGPVCFYYMRCWEPAKEKENWHDVNHRMNQFLDIIPEKNNETENALRLAHIYNFNLMHHCWKDLFYAWSTLGGFGEFLYKGLFNIPGRIVWQIAKYINSKI